MQTLDVNRQGVIRGLNPTIFVNAFNEVKILEGQRLNVTGS